MTVIRESGTITQKRGGRFKIGIITPGTGSSGSYPKETIEAAGRDKVFAAGTHMYLDHATEAQSWERPEGSIKDLVGVLTEDAYWDETSGGLVAEARIYSNWKPVLEEMKDDIGISIRASGEVKEDKGKRIVTRLTEARSVDFVTRAGRGGRILEVIESARMQETTAEETRRLLNGALRAAHGGDNVWVWLRDYDDTRAWFDVEREDAGSITYEQTYLIDGVDIVMGDAPVEVVPTTQYVPKTNPAAPAGEETTQKEADNMSDTTNSDTSRVDEADAAKKNPFPPNGGESEIDKLKAENAALKAEIAELKKAKAKESRRTEVAGIVEEAFGDLNAPSTKNDLIERFTDSSFETATILSEAKTRADEIRGITGSVRGMGESAPVQESDRPKHTSEDIVSVLEGNR